MTDLTKTITVSLSTKIFHEYIGGNKFESTELYEAESETIPANMDPAECEEVHAELRRRVEGRVAARKEALVATLKAGPAPF